MRVHPHFLFESLADAIATQLLLRNVRKDAIAPTQPSSVIVSGMVGAFAKNQISSVRQLVDSSFEQIAL